MFEAGQLKEQKSSTATVASRKKALQGHYSAKLQHFKMFQGLQVRKQIRNDHLFHFVYHCNVLNIQDEDKLEVLEFLASKKLSFAESCLKDR